MRVHCSIDVKNVLSIRLYHSKNIKSLLRKGYISDGNNLRLTEYSIRVYTLVKNNQFNIKIKFYVYSDGVSIQTYKFC